MFPSLHVSLFCPSLSVKKEGGERGGRSGESVFCQVEILYPSLDFVLDQLHNVCSVGPRTTIYSLLSNTVLNHKCLISHHKQTLLKIRHVYFFKLPKLLKNVFRSGNVLQSKSIPKI